MLITVCNGFPSLFLYAEYSKFPSSSINAILLVVEPASIPRKQFPLNFAKSLFGTVCLLCLSLNSLYSSSIVNSGFKESSVVS